MRNNIGLYRTPELKKKIYDDMAYEDCLYTVQGRRMRFLVSYLHKKYIEISTVATMLDESLSDVYVSITL